MKTSFKRFAALALAAIMVLGTMNLSAWADQTGSASGTLNRTKDSSLVIGGLELNDIVRFYKVLAEDENAVADGGWSYVAPFSAMKTTHNIAVSDIIGNTADNRPMQLTAEIAGKIARLTVQGDPVAEFKVTSGNSVTWDSTSTYGAPEPGMYVAIIKAGDIENVYNPVFVSVDYVQSATNGSNVFDIEVSKSSYSNSAAAKKSKITVEKSADTTEQSWADGGLNRDNSEYTHAIGDSVSFFVDTTIPGFGKVYENPTFEISDSMTNLDLVTDSIKIYTVVDGVKTELTSGFTIPTDTLSKAGYKIVFNDDYLINLAEPIDIRVEYTALVNTDAAENVTVEQNKVKIRYSTNPTHSSDHDGIPESPGDFNEKKDETNHYTFSIDASSLFGSDRLIGKSGSEFVKIGLDAAGRRIDTSTTWSQVTALKGQEGPLQGAKFRLYTNQGCTEEYIPKNVDGSPKYAAGTDAGVFTSNAAGKFTISGLDAGIYYLKEIQAPAGFIKHQDPVKIEITTTIVPQNITEYYYKGVWYKTEAKAQEIAQADVPAGKNAADYYAEFIKPWTYTTDRLDDVTIQIDNQPITKHKFIYTSEKEAEIEWTDEGSVEIPASIPNTQGVELPSTGGLGTTIFYAGGAMLVLLAGILLVSKRRIA